jgi:hypothetical protein
MEPLVTIPEKDRPTVFERDEHSHHKLSGLTNYSVFRYSGGAWQLVETRFEPGFISDDSPRRPGAYEGETIRRPAVRAR